MKQRLFLVLWMGLATATACRRHHVAPPVSAPISTAATVDPKPIVAPEPTAPEPVREAFAPQPPAAPPPAGPKLTYERREEPDGGIGTTVNGHPDGPKAEEMNKILQAGLPKMESCLNASTEIAAGKPIKVDVQYKVGNDGKPTEVQVRGPVSAAVQSCLVNQVSGLPYPAFGGPSVAHSFPIEYQRAWK